MSTAVPHLGQGNDPISGQQDTSQAHKGIASGASSEILRYAKNSEKDSALTHKGMGISRGTSSEILKPEILRSEANSMPPGIGVGLGVGVRPGGWGGGENAGAKSVRAGAPVDMTLRQLQRQFVEPQVISVSFGRAGRGGGTQRTSTQQTSTDFMGIAFASGQELLSEGGGLRAPRKIDSKEPAVSLLKRPISAPQQRAQQQRGQPVSLLTQLPPQTNEAQTKAYTRPSSRILREPDARHKDPTSADVHGHVAAHRPQRGVWPLVLDLPAGQTLTSPHAHAQVNTLHTIIQSPTTPPSAGSGGARGGSTKGTPPSKTGCGGGGKGAGLHFGDELGQGLHGVGGVGGGGGERHEARLRRRVARGVRYNRAV